MPHAYNELEPYKDILAAARAKQFREWEPKIRYLAEQLNAGRLLFPPDPVLRSSLMGMKENRNGIDMSTIDTNARMLAQALWDARMSPVTHC